MVARGARPWAGTSTWPAATSPAAAAAYSENFAREAAAVQHRLVKSAWTGTTQLDASGLVPAYDQATIQQVALALTPGWTYAGSGSNNWGEPSGPLVPQDVNHDMRAKGFLGCNLPANQAQADMRPT